MNRNSTITITNSSTAPKIAIALLELICTNTKNKNTVNKHYYLESKEFLQYLTIKTYNDSISGTKVYDKWLDVFITKVW